MSDPEDTTSDSGSSRDSSRASSRAGRSRPEVVDKRLKVTATGAGVAPDENLTPTQAAPPGPDNAATEIPTPQDAYALDILSTQPDDADSPDQAAFDFVVVPGVYGTSRPGDAPWLSPGSGTYQWLSDHHGVHSYTNGGRVLRFDYPSRALFSGRRSRDAIRTCAVQLLRRLHTLRQGESRKRLVMFIAHDVGGLIVKDALVAASQDPSWHDIADLSRVVVFCGCPHRSLSLDDMAHRLCAFLYSDLDGHGIQSRPDASSVPGFAAAAIEVNASFINSKVPLRCRIVSIYAAATKSENPATTSPIHQVFNGFCGTLGVPLERLVPELPGEADSYPSLPSHLSTCADELEIVVGYSPAAFDEERTLLSLASPVPPMRDARDPEGPLTRTPEYIAWLKSKGPQILYIHGSFDTRGAAEQIFSCLDHQDQLLLGRSRHVVLFFSFDRWDARYDSIKHVASTFLAALLCQYPKLSLANPVKRMLARLSIERAWTEEDILHWFDIVWSNPQLDNITCILNHFDDCPEESRTAFLATLSPLMQGSEGIIRLVVTSHTPGSLLAELEADYPLTVLDLSAATFKEPELRPPSSLPLEALGQEVSVEHQWSECAALDPVVRNILWEQAKTRPDWPVHVTLSEMFGPLDPLGPGKRRDDECLAILLTRVLDAAPKPDVLKNMLAWLLYTIRPLTVPELASALADTLQDPAPGSQLIHDTKQQIETWLAGIFEIHQNEIKVVHPRIRNIMMRGSGNTYLWKPTKESAHVTIASRCLKYLCRPGVQERLASMCKAVETSPSRFSPDTRDLCSYALLAWPHHFARVPHQQGQVILGELLALERNTVAQNLARGHWILSNPAMRSRQPPESIFPIFAGLGLPNAMAQMPANHLDRFHGLLEAAACGHGDIARELYKSAEFSEPELLEAVVAAATTKNERLVLDLMDFILSKSAAKDAIAWPPILLYRAAWIGLPGVAGKLLELGCPAHPPVPWASDVMTSPLHDAVRNSHDETVRILVQHGAEVHTDFQSDRGLNALHVAASYGVWGPVLKALLETGNVNMEAKDTSEFTPLYYSCLYGHYKTAEVLLQSGADPMMGNPSDEWTPLVVAADNGFDRCVRILLEHGANTNCLGPLGTPLCHAAINGHVQVCRSLLDAKADPRSPHDSPPILIQVIQTSKEDAMLLDVFSLLVEHGADVHAEVDSKSVLMYAAAHSHGSPFVQVLLDHGADVGGLTQERLAPLHFAASEGSPSSVEALLKKGADPDVLSTGQLTPVYYAVATDAGSENPERLRILLEGGANPDLSSANGYSALMHAAWFGYNGCIELLLRHGADPNRLFSNDEDPEHQGWTALVCAAWQGKSTAVRLLAEKGADLQCKSIPGDPVITKAAIDDNDTLSVLLEYASRVDINATDGDGKTALHKGGISMANLRRLVNAGVNVNAQDKQGDTPLSAAASLDDMAKATYLVQRGADVDPGDEHSFPPLFHACQGGHFEMANWLMDNKANVNRVYQGTRPGTALAVACLMNAGVNDGPLPARMIECLLNRGAEINRRGGIFGYALSVAAFRLSCNHLRMLLDAGAEVNVKDDGGRSPVQFAATHSVANLQEIMAAGGDAAAMDLTNRSALHYAAAFSQVGCVERLLSLSTSPPVDCPDIDGWTPLCWAVRGPRSSIVDGRAGGDSPDQLEVVRLLLSRGADASIVVHLDGQAWTPLKIARFSDARDELIELLEKHVLEKQDSDVLPQGGAYETKAGRPKNGFCDFCLQAVYGFAWTCRTCSGAQTSMFWFCFKCYPHRKLLHDPTHEFYAFGEEFTEPEEKAVDEKSSTDSSIDDDSDDSD